MKKITWLTATALVVSNMIGTGIFTSLGYQVAYLTNTYSIILLWVIGGILALFGAFCYSELGNYYKESGGDYIYLSRGFHPFFGYLSSWISLIVGFSAPVALAALAMSKYLQIFGLELGKEFAIGIIILTALTQSFSLRMSSDFQNGFTMLKVLFVLGIIGLGLYFAPQVQNGLNFNNGWIKEVQMPEFASSLVFVSFAYTGWNSASYIVGEIKNPTKNLPKSLIIGTLFVTLVYVLINYVFLKHAPISSLVNQEDVASIAANGFLGLNGAKWVSFFIAAQLIATISGYLWIGSRVSFATAKENKLWSFMNKSKNGIPYLALWVHALIAIIIILTGEFEEIFIYASFLLQILATLAVATVFTIPSNKRYIFKGKYFWIFPVVFLAFGVYICYFTFIAHQKESLIGLSTILIGLILYFFDTKYKIKP
ncbi:MAG: amino acid permease [Flavobacterium sp.]|uniref:APC family permease n=1 Tax=Flavobacterium sp. TaxID=239 RepID=UPI00262C676C|nr:amino acid permease [Flavobacterium sp.]MDD5149407.1 amino acid permease [Flavobacterium sp.]